jgi:hypothetical protein
VFTSCAFYNEINLFFSENLNLLAAFIIFILVGIFVALKSNYVHRLFMAYISGLQIHKAAKALENPKKIVWS